MQAQNTLRRIASLVKKKQQKTSRWSRGNAKREQISRGDIKCDELPPSALFLPVQVNLLPQPAQFLYEPPLW